MYRLIYNPTGKATNVNVYETWREMQEVAGGLIDDGIDNDYYIVHSIKGIIQGKYSLKDFVARTQPDNFTLGLSKDIKPGKDLERERFHNLDEKETAEVLKYTPTGALIGELVRRSNEYEKTVASIYKLLDNMKVYDIN